MYVVIILDSFFCPSATPIICAVPLPAMAVSALLTRHIMELPSMYVSAGYAAFSPGRVGHMLMASSGHCLSHSLMSMRMSLTPVSVCLPSVSLLGRVSIV